MHKDTKTSFSLNSKSLKMIKKKGMVFFSRMVNSHSTFGSGQTGLRHGIRIRFGSSRTSVVSRCVKQLYYFVPTFNLFYHTDDLDSYFLLT